MLMLVDGHSYDVDDKKGRSYQNIDKSSKTVLSIESVMIQKM